MLKIFCSIGVALMVIYSCSSNSDPDPVVERFKVTFYISENSSSFITVDKDTKAEEPNNTTLTGFTFIGWFKDQVYTQAFDFSTETITADITLYAKFEAATRKLKLRIHVLESTNNSKINSTITRERIDFFNAESNKIWNPAYIGFEIESVVRESVETRYETQYDALDVRASSGVMDESLEEDIFTYFSEIRSAASKDPNLFHIYYMNSLFNGLGVYIGLDGVTSIFLSQTTANDEESIETFAHELGHTLSLEHVTTDQNLMYSGGGMSGTGTTGKNLTGEQIAKALVVAKTGKPFVFPR